MKVERIHNGFLVAPDFKFTEFDHKTSGLAGGYAGVVFAERSSSAAAATAWHRHQQPVAGYGGFLMQWFGRTSETFGFSGKMLIGGAKPSRPGYPGLRNRGRASLQCPGAPELLRLRTRGQRARPFVEKRAPDRRRRLPVHGNGRTTDCYLTAIPTA